MPDRLLRAIGEAYGKTGGRRNKLLGEWVLAAVLLLVVALAAAGARAAAGTGAKIVVVFGDSLGAGYNLPPDEGFAPQLERALQAAGVNVRVENASISGDTTAGGRARLDWAIIGDPDLVIVELGANDALRGLDPALTRRNLAAILARLKARGIGVLLAGMRAPPNMGREYEAAFNAIYPDLAARYGVPLYPFFLDGVAGRPNLVQRDGKHPTAGGVAEIVARIAPMVIDLLKGKARQ